MCVPALLTYGELAPVVDDAEVYMEEEAIEVTLEFLFSSPTFRTGVPESVSVTSLNRARTLMPTWSVRMDLVCKYPAYGNLVGLLQDTTYTPHPISVVVEEVVVLCVVVDGVWDELNQKMIG